MHRPERIRTELSSPWTPTLGAVKPAMSVAPLRSVIGLLRSRRLRARPSAVCGARRLADQHGCEDAQIPADTHRRVGSRSSVASPQLQPVAGTMPTGQPYRGQPSIPSVTAGDAQPLARRTRRCSDGPCSPASRSARPGGRGRVSPRRNRPARSRQPGKPRSRNRRSGPRRSSFPSRLCGPLSTCRRIQGRRSREVACRFVSTLQDRRAGRFCARPFAASLYRRSNRDTRPNSSRSRTGRRASMTSWMPPRPSIRPPSLAPWEGCARASSARGVWSRQSPPLGRQGLAPQFDRVEHLPLRCGRPASA